VGALVSFTRRRTALGPGVTRLALCVLFLFTFLSDNHNRFSNFFFFDKAKGRYDSCVPVVLKQ
jgi:hypothetical protein